MTNPFRWFGGRVCRLWSARIGAKPEPFVCGTSTRGDTHGLLNWALSRFVRQDGITFRTLPASHPTGYDCTPEGVLSHDYLGKTRHRRFLPGRLADTSIPRARGASAWAIHSGRVRRRMPRSFAPRCRKGARFAAVRCSDDREAATSSKLRNRVEVRLSGTVAHGKILPPEEILGASRCRAQSGRIGNGGALGRRRTRTVTDRTSLGSAGPTRRDPGAKCRSDLSIRR